MGGMKWLLALVLASLGSLSLPKAEAVPLRGRIVDDATGKPIPARVYVLDADGGWHHVASAAKDGTAVTYSKRRPGSEELHTTLSAHEFSADLPAGKYTLIVERGKECLTLSRDVEVGNDPVDVELRLKRWINMAEHGWFSGDTHVHRTLAELPNVVMAEDLNVALPLTAWVTDSGQAPDQHKHGRELVPEPKLIQVDSTHVIWPVNTEYEIFSIERKRHTLGAMFVLNHAAPLKTKVPPVAPAVVEARGQGRRVLLDLDKHNWPWSMMLPPVAKVELFELSNNHI